MRLLRKHIKNKNWIRITPCDHIKHFNRGHRGGFSFEESNLDLPNLCIGDVFAKNSMVQSIWLKSIYYPLSEKKITGYGFVSCYECWVKNDCFKSRCVFLHHPI